MQSQAGAAPTATRSNDAQSYNGIIFSCACQGPEKQNDKCLNPYPIIFFYLRMTNHGIFHSINSIPRFHLGDKLS